MARAASKSTKGSEKARKAARRARAEGPVSRTRFGRRSLILFAVGAVVVTVGYVTLAAGSITVAPILLVAGYCVFFPMGILMRDKRKARERGE